MPFISVDVENTTDIDLYYEDHGNGQPVVLIDGFPLDGHAWEKQIPALLAAGYRVITYDRRGFGRSGQATIGYDYDTFAADLNTLLEVLDVTDVVLAGFSMGTGEVGRYLGTYGPARIDKAVFIAALEPFLLKTDTNPAGLDGAVFASAPGRRGQRPLRIPPTVLCRRLQHRRDTRHPHQRRRHRKLLEGGVFGVGICIGGRGDHLDNRLPGRHRQDRRIRHRRLDRARDHDRILPIDATARPLHALLPRAEYVEIPGAPHGLLWTYAEDVNHELLAFLAH